MSRKSTRINRAFNEKHPIKREAHQQVWRAITAGRLAKAELCEDCGTDVGVAWHHPIYSPDHHLEVVAVCPKCHKGRHANGEGVVLGVSIE